METCVRLAWMVRHVPLENGILPLVFDTTYATGTNVQVVVRVRTARVRTRTHRFRQTLV